jgi:hypothetical protein
MQKDKFFISMSENSCRVSPPFYFISNIMWVQTIDKKRNKYFYYIDYFYSNENNDRYRVWTANSEKAKLGIWNISKDLKDISRIFGKETVVGTY